MHALDIHFTLLVHCWSSRKKKKYSEGTEETKEELGDIDDEFENDDETWTEDQLLKNVRNVVDEFRSATRYLKNSTKCKKN